MMKIVLIALLGYATARPAYLGDELAPDAEAFMSYVREYQRIFAHTANHAQLQTIFENRPMSDYINGVLGHGDGRIEAFEFNQWHAAVADLWRRFGMPGQEVIAEEWAVTDTNKDGHITPVEIYTMLRDEKAAKYFPAFFALMFAEHAKGQPFWSQAKAEDFRRNTPWADVYALPKASTAELLSEEETVKKEQGNIKAEEFAKAMGLLNAEPAIAVLPLKGGAEDVAVIPVRLPEEVANEEAATGVQQTFISSNTPILGVDGVQRLALEYIDDIADPNAPAPPPPMPNAPIDVTMPDNSIVKLLAAPVEEQPAAITTTMAAEEGKEEKPNEPVQQDAPGLLPMELPVTSIASVDGHTEVGLLQPSGTVKTLIIEQPASTLSDNNDGKIEKPSDVVGAHAQLLDPTGTTVEGTVVAVEPKLDECVDKDGKVTECVTGTIQFEDGTIIKDAPIMAGEEESSAAALIITANGKEEKMEAKIQHDGEEAHVTAVDAKGNKKVEFDLPEATGVLNKAPEANAADEPRIEGAQVPVVITDLNTGNVLSQSVATVKSFEHTPNQNNIHMEVPIRGVLLEMEVIVPVEKKPENSDEPRPEIIAAQVVLPGQHVPQPAAVIPPPAGVQEELRVLSGDGSNVEVQIFEHAEGTRASGTISQDGVITPITQISSDNVQPKADGTEILSQTFATPKGEIIKVETLQSDPSVATEALRQQ